MDSEELNRQDKELSIDLQELDSWLKQEENRKSVISYCNLRVQGEKLLYAPDAIRGGTYWKDVKRKDLWVTGVEETNSGLNLRVGDIKIEGFPARIENPGENAWRLMDYAAKINIKVPNIATRNLFKDKAVDYGRYFDIGVAAHRVAENIVLEKQRTGFSVGDKDLLAQLGALHLGCFVWGSMGYESYLDDQNRYWKGTKPISEIMKRNQRLILPRQELSQQPFGNALQGVKL